MNQKSDTYAFFAVFGYLGVVLVLMSTVAGSFPLWSTWWLILLLFAVAVGFTGAAINAARPNTGTGIVPKSSTSDAGSLTVQGTEPRTTAPAVPLSAETPMADAPPAEAAPAVDEEKRAPAVNEADLETPEQRRADAATGDDVPDERVDEEAVEAGELTAAPPTNGQEAEAQETVMEADETAPEEPIAVTPQGDTAEPDDLTKLEGIGPKMSKALIAGGVTSFEKLSTMSVSDIRAVLDAQGQRFAPAAESWAEQASLAAKGDWDGLQALQDTLIAGRYPTND